MKDIGPLHKRLCIEIVRLIVFDSNSECFLGELDHRLRFQIRDETLVEGNQPLAFSLPK